VVIKAEYEHLSTDDDAADDFDQVRAGAGFVF
jgi:hypothetical protein